jgi:hypothetical protein
MTQTSLAGADDVGEKHPYRWDSYRAETNTAMTRHWEAG